MKTLFTYVKIILFSALGAIALVALLNPLAEWYVRHNPDVMMTVADRVNIHTRAVRAAMTPKDKIKEWFAFDKVEDYDAFWDERYTVGVVFESYVHFRSRAVVGKYHGVTDAGYRLVKDNGPWPPDSSNFNIFFFGGSTSFGVSPYWATVSSYLQEHFADANPIGRPVRVYNFGRSGYQSTQETILLMQLLTDGYIPDMVVFMDGVNDMCWRDGNPGSWTALERFFNESNTRYRTRIQGYGIGIDWHAAREFITSQPIFDLIANAVDRITEPPPPEYLKQGPDKKIIDEPAPPREEIDTAIERYFENTRVVKGMGSEYGFSSLFTWQPVPVYKYSKDAHQYYPTRLGCHTGSRDGYPIMRDYFDRGIAPSYLWLADMQEDIDYNLYVDTWHYTAPMSDMIAGAIHDYLIGNPALITGDTTSQSN